ncbi:putative short-chain dehydrogenase reductase family oxidoreductase [Phaeomoniella chlamydospora]|uniref:Putative short-chain dehydrogenase reductase family oxidoreductase n=1 Tax=Phaeomoniella chlamydospora TaxID=158046 RepID=A0A0G2GD37_PHACM|nr:putative short-chain dehydrogenase reductase family oxidoreductase [Phaeomoniella chlamydospora]
MQSITRTIRASRGIGEALARKFVENGSSVIAIGRRKENLERLVNEYGNDKVSAVPFDISNLAAIPSFCKSIIDSHPDLDYILFNSGIQRKADFSDPDSIDMSVISEEFTINYLSYLAITKGFLPLFLGKKGEAGLCYVTSALALVPLPPRSNYCASKAALHQWIISLRYQLAESRVKVYELLPPAVQTELHDAKHQPDIKNGRNFGMPLDQFTEQAYAGLAAKKESVPIGTSKSQFEALEPLREKLFRNFMNATKPK